MLNPEILKREKKGEGPFVYEVLDRGKGNVPGHRFISVTELDTKVKRAMLEAAATARHEESAADSIVEMKFNKACQLALQNFSVDIGRFKRKVIHARRTDSWKNIDLWLNALKPEE